MLLPLCLAATQTFAVLNIQVMEIDGGVTFTASGSVDVTNLFLAGNGPIPERSDGVTTGTGAEPSDGYISIGTPGSTVTTYILYGDPISFGTGGFRVSSSLSGDGVGINVIGNTAEFFIYQGYVSGDTIDQSMRFDDITFEEFGLTPSTYTYSWGGTGEHADSIVIQVVPEPSTCALLAGAAALGFAVLRHRRRAAYKMVER